jgi:hypothetical protein
MRTEQERYWQLNEMLCKVLCHNLCVIIQAIHKLRIEPTFEKMPFAAIRETHIS